ncbi:hypothetical protein AJ80_02262 [Polytolypa hystricis UAMH7299]|uniref:Uncharacterized protein n=1 Tax=Polytolypa hystricis (strain UAMH7299) TaxID=1447883 RepID=A0A2B7YPR2_POLH7|nr:hypothetical protein AJ80_02262 [Polytolypa hystricis UAMH7299]
MCQVRAHHHQPCSCTSHHLHFCSEIQPRLCPTSPPLTSRFLTINCESFSPLMLAACPRLHIYPSIIDPYPCAKHKSLLSEKGTLFLALLPPPLSPSPQRHAQDGTGQLGTAGMDKTNSNDSSGVNTPITTATAELRDIWGLCEKGCLGRLDSRCCTLRNEIAVVDENQDQGQDQSQGRAQSLPPPTTSSSPSASSASPMTVTPRKGLRSWSLSIWPF